jgi:hypothetical protein
MKANWKTIVAAAGIAALSATGMVGCGGSDENTEADTTAAGDTSTGGDTGGGDTSGGDTGGENSEGE